RAVHAARDPAWVADGFVSDRWLPICPVSGRIDAFEWKAPPAAIGQASEPVDEAVALEPSRPTIEAKPAAPVAPPPAPASPPKAPPAVKKGPRAVPESVVPITHVPDDPGPPEPDQDR